MEKETINEVGNQHVLVELILLRGTVKEYRRQVCHRKSIPIVRSSLAKGAVIIGSWVSDTE